MKAGKLPPMPEDGDLRGWCAFDSLEPDDYFPMLGFKGDCPNCGTIQLPFKFMAVYVKMDGNHHVFKAMEDVYCAGCNVRVEDVSVLCQSVIVDVTEEFRRI